MQVDETTPEQLFYHKRAVVVAPAGCGKTELIVRSLQFADKKQLILTHTHAGVKSLLDRLKKLKIPSHLYQVDTITGFAVRLALNYPSYATKKIVENEKIDFPEALQTAIKILSTKWARKVISISYFGLYVDEYQDCTIEQHQLILKFLDIMPCRILGDPLQGIFDFNNNVSVNWENDVFPIFERLADLKTPWRWVNNKELGEWLLQIRAKLIKNETIDLSSNLPKNVSIFNNTDADRINSCYQLIKSKSVAAIFKWPNQAHDFASKLNGSYTSMEEIERKDLIKWTKKFDSYNNAKLAHVCIDFSSCCLTKVSTELRTIKEKLNHETVSTRITKNKQIYEKLVLLKSNKNKALIIEILESIKNIPNAALYRKELWYEMLKALRESKYEKSTITDIAIRNREIERHIGRNVPYKVVTRTLLIKGLEFESSLVMNANELTAKEFYVAITRGSTNLIIFNNTNFITH